MMTEENGELTEPVVVEEKSGFGKRGLAIAGMLGMALTSCGTSKLPPKDVPTDSHQSPAEMLEGMVLLYGSPAMMSDADRTKPKR